MLQWKLKSYRKGPIHYTSQLHERKLQRTGNALQCSESPSLYQSTFDECFFSFAKYPKCKSSVYVSLLEKIDGGQSFRKVPRKKVSLSAMFEFSLLMKTFPHHKYNNLFLLAHILHHYAAAFFSGLKHSRKTHSRTDCKSKGTE